MEIERNQSCKICGDGKKMKRLGFHVRKMHNLNMKEYAKWNRDEACEKQLPWFKRIWFRLTMNKSKCPTIKEPETHAQSVLQVNQSIKHD
ncbi:MAG: hypothetical protein JNL74_21425 [Fibrobacteres bacterium]|nr:hypothetical protein [Fibrobacterota bacterium]